MKIRLAERSEAEGISRFVSELAVTHIGLSLQLGGLENLLKSMDVGSTITQMTDGFPHWVALEHGAIVGIAVVKPRRTFISCSSVQTGSEPELDNGS
jgi:hypothetical protein